MIQEPRYQHTQFGLVTVLALGGAIALVVLLTWAYGFNWIPVGVAVILGFCLVLFATLTVSVTDDRIAAWLGPGLIRREFRVRDIESCRRVRNSWYYGWGVRFTPHGWLFNVSGLDAVELLMKSGARFRIGTDEPEALVRAVRQALGRPVERPDGRQE